MAEGPSNDKDGLLKRQSKCPTLFGSLSKDDLSSLEDLAIRLPQKKANLQDQSLLSLLDPNLWKEVGQHLGLHDGQALAVTCKLLSQRMIQTELVEKPSWKCYWWSIAMVDPYFSVVIPPIVWINARTCAEARFLLTQRIQVFKQQRAEKTLFTPTDFFVFQAAEFFWYEGPYSPRFDWDEVLDWIAQRPPDGASPFVDSGIMTALDG